MAILHALVTAAPETLWLLIALTVGSTFLLLIGLCGYVVMMRYKNQQGRETAGRAHQEVLALIDAQQDFRTLQKALVDIDKSLNQLAMHGPERVNMVLATIRQDVGQCLEIVQALRAAGKEGH